MIKKIILSLVLFFAVFGAGKVMAANAGDLNKLQNTNGTGNSVLVDPQIFKNDTQNAITTGNMSALPYFGGTTFFSVLNGARCAIDDFCNVPTIDPATGKPRAGGAIGTMAMAIGGLYNKPASTVDYINNIAQNAGFPSPIKPAYAASGIGFTSLTPILELWKIVRNIAYLIFSVVFVVIGLMILLRVKIDPKTVISVQNALPKIFWSLILITFSYPLAGFLIDMMYVLIGVILSVVSLNPNLASATANISKNLPTESIFGLMGADKWISISVAGGTAIQGIVSSLLGAVDIANIGSVTVGALGGLIIAIAILYALVKTWLALLGAYVNILIGVILSPLAMMVEAIPGQSGLGMWLRSMLANLLAFPLVITLMLFGAVIMSYGYQGQSVGSTTAFVPPLLGGNNMSSVTALIGLGILLMIPKAVAILSDFFKAPPFKYGMAWADSFKDAINTGRLIYSEKQGQDKKDKENNWRSQEEKWRRAQAAKFGISYP